MKCSLTNSCSEHESGRSEEFVQVLDEEDEVVSVSAASSSLPRVLPVQVKTIEVVSLDESQRGLGECSPEARIRCHLTVLLTSLVPATDSKSDLGQTT